MGLFCPPQARRLAPVLLVALLGVLVQSGGLAEAEQPLKKPASSSEQKQLQQALEEGRNAAKNNNHEAAIRAYEKALPLAQGVYGEDNSRMALLLNDLGLQYEKAHQYAKAARSLASSIAILEARQPNSANLATVLCNLGRAQAAQRQYREAIANYQRCLTIREEKLGANHADIAVVANLLANAYYFTAQYDKAEPLYKRSLQIYQANRGHELAAAMVQNNLGNLYKAMNQLDQAERFYRQAVATRAEKLDKNHALLLQTLENLASVYQRKKQYAQAEKVLQDCLQRKEEKWGADDPQVAMTLESLASLYEAKEEPAKALSCYERCLEIRKGELGESNLLVASTLNKLGNFHHAQGDLAKAEPLYRRSLQIREDKLGAEHLDVATSLSNLGSLFWQMGEYAKAEPLYQRSLQIREAKLGKDHPDVAAVLNNLAEVYQSMSQYARAEQLYQRSLQIREAKLGQDHPAVTTNLNDLAWLYQTMGDYAKAEPLYQRSLQIREEKLGKDHPHVALSLGNLASLYQAMGQYKRAEPLLQRSLEIREARKGKDHPYVANSLYSLASLYRDMGQYAKAEPLILRSLEIRETKLGKDQPAVAGSLNMLALLYHETGQYARAEPLYRRSLEIYEAKLGQDHPSVGMCLNNLGKLYQDMEQYARAEPLYKRSIQINESKRGKDHPLVAHGYKNLALLLVAQGHWADAAESFEKSCRSLQHHVQHVLIALSEQEQLTFLRTKYEPYLHTALTLASLRAGKDGDLSAPAAAWLLNGKALAQQTLAEQALLRRDARGKQADDIRQLLELRGRLASLARITPSPGREKEHREQLEQAKQQEQQLAKRLSQTGGRSLPDTPWVELEDLRKALPADDVFINIAHFRPFNFQAKGQEGKWQTPHYVAFVIPSWGKGDVRLIDLGEATPIEQAIATARQALQDAPRQILRQGEVESEKEVRAALQALSRLVLKPLMPSIGAHKRWLVSPDGALWLVPWAALPLDDDRYVIEKYALRYLVSGRELVTKAEANRNRTSAVQLFADPDFDLAPSKAAGSTRGLTAASPALSGLTLHGSIADLKVLFQLGQDGTLLIRDKDSNETIGEGKWKQEDDQLLMQTRLSRFEGRIEGTTISGTRIKQSDGQKVTDRWQARLPAEVVAAFNLSHSKRAIPLTDLHLPSVNRLPGTAREAASVARRLRLLTEKEPVVLTGAQASEARVKEVERPKILMLSTHGFFLADQKMEHKDETLGLEGDPATAVLDGSGKRVESPLRRCGLLLAGCNQHQQARAGEEDGILLGEEVVELDLRGTELVVLSACETGLGQVRNSEGVAGLRQAFQLAGAQSVLATLWQIPDRETAQLMTTFFEQLTQSTDRGEALRQAQLSLIQARRKRYEAAHPFYWAAFTLTGNN